mgnify:CR=1 FL=1
MGASDGPDLPGFRWLTLPGGEVLTRPEAEGWIRQVLEAGDTLHEAAARDRRAVAMEGRGTVWIIPSKLSGTWRTEPEKAVTTAAHWAVRHYMRGGRVVSRLLGDRYLRVGDARPFQEALVSEAVRARGVPATRVMAAARYSAGPFYRADLVTEFVPGSSDLVEALFDERRRGMGGAVERRDALRAAGELVRRLGQAGVTHLDLHAGNVLLQWEGAAPSPRLVDLDRCRVERAEGGGDRQAMHARLRRSLRKWEKATDLTLTEAEWEVLEEAALG